MFRNRTPSTSTGWKWVTTSKIPSTMHPWNTLINLVLTGNRALLLMVSNWKLYYFFGLIPIYLFSFALDTMKKSNTYICFLRYRLWGLYADQPEFRCAFVLLLTKVRTSSGSSSSNACSVQIVLNSLIGEETLPWHGSVICLRYAFINWCYLVHHRDHVLLIASLPMQPPQMLLN